MKKALFAATVVLAGSHQVNADLVESFSGTGPYSSSSVLRSPLEGFDNPGWIYNGDGIFRDGGLWLENRRNAPLDNDSDHLLRDVEWKEGFDSTIQIRDHVLAVDPTADGAAGIHFSAVIGTDGRDALSIAVTANSDTPGIYSARLTSGETRELLTVEQGPHILMSIVFDEETSRATYLYDNNLDDDVAPMSLATLHYSRTIREDGRVALDIAKTDGGHADALIDHWIFNSIESPILPGDFNENGTFDAGDIDLLNAEIRMGTNKPEFDLVDDGIVDQFDRNFWVHSLNDTFFGDANLDGEFNSRDLVAVFQAGHYEDGIDLNSGWAEGDWNGNGDFESGDLIVAFQDGGYEVGPRAAAAVPEPTSLATFLAGVIGLALVSNCRRRAV